MRKIKQWGISIAVPLAVGGLAALVTSGSYDIYNRLTLPPLSPPGWLFPVIWTLLYILMGISNKLYMSCRPCNTRGNTYYAISLALNFLWPIIFFKVEKYLTAFVILVLLWISILLTVSEYNKFSVKAARLQIPYLIWVTFAGYLNLAVCFLN